MSEIEHSNDIPVSTNGPGTQRDAAFDSAAGLTALIIDDAYDSPTDDEVAESIPGFRAQLNNANEATKVAVLSAIGADKAPTKLNEEEVSQLWRVYESNNDTRPVLTALFAKRASELEAVAPIEAQLRQLLGNDNVSTLGSRQALPKDHFDVVFLDYRLGGDNKTQAVAHARKTAEQIVAIHMTADESGSVASTASASFLMLMSADSVEEKKQEEFRSETGLHRSLFEFANKSDLSDGPKIAFRMKRLKGTLGTRQSVHVLASSLGRASRQMAESFDKAMKTLGIEDIAYLQRIALKKDGHPLGDYLVWLFSELAGQIVSTSDVVDVPREALNRVSFDDLIPLRYEPTVEVAEMYRAAISEPIKKGWCFHPHDPERTIPHLHFGDVWIHENKRDVLMVLNAACDLAFAPGQKRKADSELSILLLPGTLIPIHSQHVEGLEEPKIELFEYDEKGFRITWRYKRVISVKHKDILRDFESTYRPIARLRGIYAIEIQQAFASHATRIGTPNTPPVFGGEAAFKAYYKGVDKRPVQLTAGEPSSGVFFFHQEDGCRFMLSEDGAVWIHDQIGHAIQAIRDQLPQLSGKPESTAKEVISKLEKLEQTFLLECDFLNEETSVPNLKKGKRPDLKWPTGEKVSSLLCLHFGETLEDWPSEAVIAICFSVSTFVST